MARQARVRSKSGMYRVTLRGAELFRKESDKEVFSQMLEKYFETGEIYGVNLAETEINLVVKEGENGISMTMKPLTTSYARYFNRTYGLDGKLFTGRFISVPIETEDEKKEQLEFINNPSKGTVKSVKRTVRGTQKPKKEEEVKPKETRRVQQSLPSWLL